MRKTLLAIATVLWTSTAYATPITYYASLTGPNESPANSSPGSGIAVVTIDTAAHTLHIVASFSGLLGTTTASHIHCCTLAPLSGTAGVATQTPSFIGFPLGVTSGTYDHTFDTLMASTYNTGLGAFFIVNGGGTAAGAEAALAAGLASNSSYYNIHSSVFGGGEIRGFLTTNPVPEPATLSLLGLGLSGLVAAARRRQRKH